MPLNLRANLPVDDNDSHISYSAGDWQVLSGSTRQWGGAVHSTTKNGATVAFAFQGQAFSLFVTLPGGGTTVAVDISIDGGAPIRRTWQCSSSNEYAFNGFDSSIMEFRSHTVIITNRGPSSLMFDEVQLFSSDINPSMLSPPTIPKSTTTSTRTSTSTTNRAAVVTSSTTSTSAPSTTITSAGQTEPGLQQTSTSTTTGTTSQGGTSNSDSNQDAVATRTTGTSSSTTSQTLTGTAVNSKTSLGASLSNSTTVVEVGTTTFVSTDSRGDVVTYTNTFTTSIIQSVETGIMTTSAAAHRDSLGAIIGSVFGGLAFIVLALLAFLLVRRRSRSRDHEHFPGDGTGNSSPRKGKPLAAYPFMLSPNPATQEFPYPTHASRPFAPAEKSGIQAQQRQTASAEQLNMGYQAQDSPVSPSEGIEFVYSPQNPPGTVIQPSGAYVEVDAGISILQRSNSGTTSSSMYASPIAGPGQYFSPPPYQPSIAGRIMDMDNHAQSPIREKS